MTSGDFIGAIEKLEAAQKKSIKELKESQKDSINRLRIGQRDTTKELSNKLDHFEAKISERVTKLETVVGERTKDMVSVPQLNAAVSHHRAKCMSERYNRDLDNAREDTRGNALSPAPPLEYYEKVAENKITAKLVAAVAGIGTGVGGLGIAVWKLVEALLK